MFRHQDFDTADIAAMEQAGTFEGVILHEMGHAIGVGWDSSVHVSPCRGSVEVFEGPGGGGVRIVRAGDAFRSRREAASFCPARRLQHAKELNKL